VVKAVGASSTQHQFWASAGPNSHESSPRCAASTVWRRLCAPFCRVSSFLCGVSSARNHRANTQLLTSSGGRARCGPARTTPAATCCLLHVKLPTARWASFTGYRTLLPSMERTGMRVVEVAVRIGPCRATGVGVVSERDVRTGHSMLHAHRPSQ
jgi:hypothetical protein